MNNLTLKQGVEIKQLLSEILNAVVFAEALNSLIQLLLEVELD